MKQPNRMMDTAVCFGICQLIIGITSMVFFFTAVFTKDLFLLITSIYIFQLRSMCDFGKRYCINYEGEEWV